MEQQKMSAKLQETKEQYIKTVQIAEKMKDDLKILELQNSKLQAKIKKRSNVIEELQNNKIEYYKEKQSLALLKVQLEYSLEKEKKKNSELEKEISRFKKFSKTPEMTLNKHENGEISFHKDLKNHQFKADLQSNMLRQKTQAETHEDFEKLRESHTVPGKRCMEDRIKNIQSAITVAKTQLDSNKILLQKQKHTYLQELRDRITLCHQLNKTKERLEEANVTHVTDIQPKRYVTNTLHTKPVSAHPCDRNLHSSLGENLEAPASNQQSFNECMEDHLSRMYFIYLLTQVDQETLRCLN
ncbi:ankyrin repeat domain-containing protein 26-like isoform X2 [Castor canadensis]|uniref:Ankyrin repeat domain-containing protein 26-like isoform X2 n=1 Tax=Castor canadensis TaxID=51338 RepID=A0AC58K4K0_CASCN